jgi:membrane protein implicated in regulation of membrane protease activity
MTRGDWLYLAFALVCLSAVTWPGFALFGNRIAPFVLGIPFSFAWNVAWLLISFLGLLVYHVTRGRE